MKTLIIKRVLLVIITILEAAMFVLSGVLIGYSKGYKDGEEHGFYKGKLHQILEDIINLLKDKEPNNKQIEKENTTEN